MSFSETTAKRTTREKIQSVHISVYSEQPVEEYQRTLRPIISRQNIAFFLYLIHHSRVSRSIFATKQGLMTPLLAVSCISYIVIKAKQKNRRYLSKVQHFCTLSSHQLWKNQPGKNMQLFCTAPGLTNTATDAVIHFGKWIFTAMEYWS